MNFNDQVAAAQKIMMDNMAAQMAALRKAQEQAHIQKTKDLSESFAGAVPVHGKFLVNGPGESEKDVWFNVAFTNVPVVTFGFEIKGPDNLVWTNNPDPNFPANISDPVSGLVEGDAPIITALVVDWHTEEALPADQKYIGAKIITVCDGPTNTAFICHWSASGMALSNPAAGNMANKMREVIDDARYAQVQWRPGQAGLWEGQWYRGDETPPGYGG